VRITAELLEVRDDDRRPGQSGQSGFLV